MSTQTIPIDDHRQVVVQMWRESGYTFVTYFIPTNELEDMDKEELLQCLRKHGFQLSDQRSYSVDTMTDANQLKCWRITYTIAETDD